MEILGKITAIVIAIVLSFLVGLLGVYVMLSIANLFDIKFITQFSFVQVYGIWCIMSLAKYKYEKAKEEESESDKSWAMFAAIITDLLVFLSMWGLTFIAHWILT